MDFEIFLNYINFFNSLILFYIFLGLLFFIVVISFLVKNIFFNVWFIKIFYMVILFCVIVYFMGLVLCWYVSGYLFWSNVYEFMFYIVWVFVVVGFVLCFKFALLVFSFLVGIAFFVVYLGFMDL